MHSLAHVRNHDRLLRDLRRAQDLSNEGRPDEALRVMQGIQRACSKLGVSSAHVLWALAVIHDEAGHLEQAFDAIIEAVRADPLSVFALNSAKVIVGHIKTKLRDERWTEVSVKLYGRLFDEGLADDESHVAYAQYLLDQGRAEEALHVLEAVTALNPRLERAWEVLKAVGKVLGRSDLVTTATTQLAGLQAEAAELDTTAWGQA